MTAPNWLVQLQNSPTEDALTAVLHRWAEGLGLEVVDYPETRESIIRIPEEK